MHKYPQDPESKSGRKVIWTAIFFFIAGFFLTLILMTWVLIHFSDTKISWWRIWEAVSVSFVISVIGGLIIASIAITVLQKYYYRRGVYRCPFCNRPLKNMKDICNCPKCQEFKKITNRDQLDEYYKKYGDRP
jgi:cytochrome c biogenesis protein CcdA